MSLGDPSHVDFLGDLDICSILALGFVKGIRVEGLVGYDVVFQKGFEIFLAILAEKESIDLRAEFLKCEVGRGEEGSAFVVRLGNGVEETGLGQPELQGAEFCWEELDDLEGGWWWEQKRVDAVNHTISAKL